MSLKKHGNSAHGNRIRSIISTVLIATTMIVTIPSIFTASAVEPDTIVSELENGTFNGTDVTNSSSIAGYTGDGYVTGFKNVGDSVAFNVDVAKAGVYELSLRSALYIENIALDKNYAVSVSSTQTAGNVADGNPERGSYWGSGAPVSEEHPRWIQFDLGMITPINMIRLRIVTDWGARNQTFSILGSLDNETFTTLKESDTYYFTPAGGGNYSGNYVDAEFNTAQVRYVRVLFTGVSDAGSNGAQVGEFEIYSPNRSANLYLDGNLVSNFLLDNDSNKIVDASWDARVLEWAEKAIGELTLTAGTHTIAITRSGFLQGNMNLDSATLELKSELTDTQVISAIDLIGKLNPIENVKANDSTIIAQAVNAYNALSETQKSLVPAASVNKLRIEIGRLSRFGYDCAISNLVCNDTSNAADWSIATNIKTGDKSHTDRDFIINEMPAQLVGCDRIIPAMDSKVWKAEDVLISFDISTSTDIYVAWDSYAAVPEWLSSDYVKTDLKISINNKDKTVFNLYKASVTAGSTVTLGNQGVDKATYFVIVDHVTVEPVTGEAFTAGAIDTTTNTLSTDLLSSFVSNRTVSQGKFDLRFVLVAKGESVQYGDKVAITFTDNAGSITTIERTVSDVYVAGSTMALYDAVTAAGITYTGAADCSLFGCVITDIPENCFTNVSVTVTRAATVIATVTSAYATVAPQN